MDRRFLHEYAARLSADAMLLYFFLTAVSDKHGLSFYSDTTIAARLRLREQRVVSARDELISDDLIAYRPPLTQVLSLTPPRVQRGGREGLNELFRVLSEASGNEL